MSSNNVLNSLWHPNLRKGATPWPWSEEGLLLPTLTPDNKMPLLSSSHSPHPENRNPCPGLSDAQMQYFWLRQELKVSLCVSVRPFGTKCSRGLILLISGSYLQANFKKTAR